MPVRSREVAVHCIGAGGGDRDASPRWEMFVDPPAASTTRRIPVSPIPTTAAMRMATETGVRIATDAACSYGRGRVVVGAEFPASRGTRPRWMA